MRMNKLLLLILLIFSSIKAFAQQYILDQIYDEQRDMGETPFSNLTILVIVIGILYVGYKIFHKEEKNDNDFDPNDEFYEELMSSRDEDPNELDIIDAERLSEDLLSRSSFGLEESIGTLCNKKIENNESNVTIKSKHPTSSEQKSETSNDDSSISPIIVSTNTTDKEYATIVKITIIADILYADFIVDWFCYPDRPDSFIDDFVYSSWNWLKKDSIKIYADGKDITKQIGGIYIDTMENAKNFYFPQLEGKKEEFRFRGIEYIDSYERRTTYNYLLRIDEESFVPSKFQFIAVELANREDRSLITKAILPDLVVYNQRKHKLEKPSPTPIYIHVVGYKRHFAFEDDEEKKKHELFYCICDVLHNKKSIVNVIGESYFPTEKGEYTDESDWGGNNDNPIEEDDEIEPIENLCFAQTIQDEYWEILINEEFDPKLLNLYKIEVTNDSENPFVYSSGIVKYNHDLYSIKQLDWLEYHKLVDSKIK